MVGVVANLFAYLKRCKCPSRDQALKNSLIVSTRADLLLTVAMLVEIRYALRPVQPGCIALQSDNLSGNLATYIAERSSRDRCGLDCSL